MNTNSNRREYVLSEIASYSSQSQAAIALGTSDRVISRWNTNKAEPRDLAVRVVQLARFIKEAGLELPPPMNF